MRSIPLCSKAVFYVFVSVPCIFPLNPYICVMMTVTRLFFMFLFQCPQYLSTDPQKDNAVKPWVGRLRRIVGR